MRPSDFCKAGNASRNNTGFLLHNHIVLLIGRRPNNVNSTLPDFCLIRCWMVAFSQVRAEKSEIANPVRTCNRMQWACRFLFEFPLSLCSFVACLFVSHLASKFIQPFLIASRRLFSIAIFPYGSSSIWFFYLPVLL